MHVYLQGIYRYSSMHACLLICMVVVEAFYGIQCSSRIVQRDAGIYSHLGTAVGYEEDH